MMIIINNKNRYHFFQKTLCIWHIAELSAHSVSVSSHKNLMKWAPPGTPSPQGPPSHSQLLGMSATDVSQLLFSPETVPSHRLLPPAM